MNLSLKKQQLLKTCWQWYKGQKIHQRKSASWTQLLPILWMIQIQETGKQQRKTYRLRLSSERVFLAKSKKRYNISPRTRALTCQSEISCLRLSQWSKILLQLWNIWTKVSLKRLLKSFINWHNSIQMRGCYAWRVVKALEMTILSHLRTWIDLHAWKISLKPIPG